MKKLASALSALTFVFMAAAAWAQTPLGTAFTYQGRLSDGGSAPTGVYDLRFQLFNAAAGGAQIGSTVTLSSVGVTNGLFSVRLDFGAAAFAGSARWLEIGVRPGGSPNPFTVLSPRQELTPAPDAIFSSTAPWSGLTGKPAGFADDVDNDSGGDITGVTAGAGLTGGGSSGDVSLAPNFTTSGSEAGTATTVARGDHVHDVRYYTEAELSTAGVINSASNPVDWTRLKSVPAGVADGLDAEGNDWRLTGNAGTSPATNFIGTTDNQALEFRVNGSRVLRLEPATFGENNVIGGASTNVVDAGTFGATICGGGQTIPSGRNRVTSLYGTVCGGVGNTAGNVATVAGGLLNIASGAVAMIPGGESNRAGGSYSFAAGRRAIARDASQSLDGDGDEGTFIWADSADADFQSTGPNQFLVRAAGGVGINTNAPLGVLHLGGPESRIFDPNALALNDLVLGRARALNGFEATGLCSGGATALAKVCLGANGGSWYWGSQVSPTTMNVTMTLAGNGDLSVAGTLTKGGGSFKIDHPLDPRNKTLSHSFVESPDMMNIYNGNVTTGGDGFATVELPEWFEALNRDFRYQLTVIGTGAWARARGAHEMEQNRFVIETDVPGTRVSWQVTGIRRDAWAEKHRIPVEEDKPRAERGRLLHPDAFATAVASAPR